MSSLSLSTSTPSILPISTSLPVLLTTSLPTSLFTSSSSSSSSSSSPSPTSPTHVRPSSSSSLPPDTSTAYTPPSTSSPSPSSTQPLADSTPSFSTSSSSAASSTSSISAAVVQQSSSLTTTTFATAAGASIPDSSSSVLVLTSGTATPSSTTTQPSSSGFFSDTGAVAGTFTVVGLVGIASVIAAVLLIARRRHSRTYEEDTEYLDKTPDLSADPPMTRVTSPDDMSSSDHTHYGAPPMSLATIPAVYYPDHAYALHPQAFQAEGFPQPVPTPYPAGYTQHYPAQYIYSPEDYDIAYPPSGPHSDFNMPNPHSSPDVTLDSPPVRLAQTALPDALRPSVKSTPTTPTQWASTRFSVDSFYSGIVTDIPVSPGQAL